MSGTGWSAGLSLGQIPTRLPFDLGAGGWDDRLIANDGAEGPFVDNARNDPAITTIPNVVFGALNFQQRSWDYTGNPVMRLSAGTYTLKVDGNTTGAYGFRLLSHRMSAGFPSPAADYTEEALDLNTYLVRNKPATFIYPGYSLASDFIMFWHILTGQIGAKLTEARKTILGQA
jgi:hypothetical protein